MKSYMKEISDTEFIDIILNGDELADKAMYDLLHHRLHHQLKKRFEVYQHQLYDDFDDIVEDFFLYLREGEEGKNQQTYQSLRCIEKKESFESWTLNTFRNYLSVRAAKERRITYAELSIEDVADGENTSSLLTDEQMLSLASQLIAYAHQEFVPRDCFIFLRTLLTMLNKQKALPNEAMAKALGMTNISYRVAVYRMKCHLADYRSRLFQDKSLHLDDKHQQMAQHINDDFMQLYPTLLGYYNQAIDKLNCAETIKQLRRNHHHTTGSFMHEPESFYSATLSIKAFWNKLNQFLIV